MPNKGQPPFLEYHHGMIMLLRFSKGFGPRKFVQCPQCPQIRSRNVSTDVSLRRSYLYVPASSDRMLEKSLTTKSDMIIYDLEDSVSPSPSDKASARNRLQKFLTVCWWSWSRCVFPYLNVRCISV